MNYQITALKLSLHRQLRRPGVWCALLLVLLSVLWMRRSAERTDRPAAALAGVVLPEDGGEALWSALEKRSGAGVRFVEADRAEAEKKVASSQWDCALLFPEDLEERIKGPDYEELVTLMIGPGSTVYPLVRETAAAVLAEQAAPWLAERYAVRRGILDQGQLREVRPELRRQLSDEDRVLVHMETLDGKPLDPLALAEGQRDRSLQGCVALLTMLWSLFTAMDLGRWRETPAARRLYLCRSTAELLTPRLLASMITALLLGGTALLGGTGLAGIRAVLLLLPCLAVYGVLALLLAGTGRLWTVLPVLLPFAAVAGGLLTPIFFDLSTLAPSLAPLIRWLPGTLYLRGCAGEPGEAWKLMTMALLCLLAAGGWARLGALKKR